MTERPLRFCMITTFYPPYNFGGDGIFVRRLANELAQHGHHVDVIHCLDSFRLLARRMPEIVCKDHPNVTVHRLKSPFGFLSPLGTQQTGRPLFKSNRIRQILNKGFDVIHYHNISLVGGPKILEYGQAVKLYTMHEHWLICPTHILLKFNRKVCIRSQCLLCSLVYKRPPQWWRYTRLLTKAVKHIDAFIAPSRFTKEIHQQRGLDIPIEHIPNFAPPPDEEPPEAIGQISKETFNEPYFLFVGRLEKLKGLHTLIPIFRRYNKAKLLIAGSGSYESKLKRIAGNSPNIEFLGFKTSLHLQALYRQAKAVIIPSMCYEVFSLVIAEAFQQKTPVLIRNLSGNLDLIKESGGGLVYDTDKELVATMDRLVSDQSLRDELGRCGYQTWWTKCTPEVHLQQYFSLIKNIKAAAASPAAP